MSFRDNLQHLRATRGMTQEQLAMLLGVSRQSVTKWEAERAYLEMDKLLKMCSLFDCTLDELIQGDLTARPMAASAAASLGGASQDVCGYDEHMRKRALCIATGLAALTAGVAAGLLFEGTLRPQDFADAVLVGCILLGLVVALALWVPTGMAHRAFVKAHPYIEDFYTEEERARARRTFALGVVGGLACIFAGGVALLLLDGREPYDVVALLACTAPGLWLIVYGALMNARTNFEAYSEEAVEELSARDIEAILDEERRIALRSAKRRNDVSAVVCGTIMLLATIVGLALLFIPAVQSPFFWLSWVFGGILCGVAGLVVNVVVKE